MSKPFILDKTIEAFDVLERISLADFLSDTESALNNNVGVVLAPDETAEELVPFLGRLQVVLIEFPVFTDGRGFTTARELREFYKYERQIRATGDVLVDQVYPLYRCGVNAFELREDQNAEVALNTFSRFPKNYQAMTGDNSSPRYA